MIGLNSGLIGVRRLPTTGSASGIWTPNEQSLAKRDINWPNVLNTISYVGPSISFTGPSMTSWALLAAGGGNGDNGGSTPSGYTRRVDLYAGRLYDSATPVNALGTLPQPGANTYTGVPSFAAELKATG